jgi:hypothetical protein
MRELTDSQVNSADSPRTAIATGGRTLGTVTSVGGAGAVVWFSVFYPNPLKYTDPDGKSPESALKLIAKHKNDITRAAMVYDIDPVGVASVIFQEKYKGVFADLKNAGAYVIDGGVHDDTPSTRSYGLAEMQLGLAAELLGLDINESGTKEEVFDILMKDNWSIALIAANIKKNEESLGIKLKGSRAGFLHNMGEEGYRRYMDNDTTNDPNDSVARRSLDYQQAIQDALKGIIDTRKDSER